MIRSALHWLLALTMTATLVVVPFVYYRGQYTRAKRLRVVTPGVLYRSGQMTADGLEETIHRLNIRTVVNFQNETPDPLLADGLPESELCRRLGVHYVFLPPDLLDRSRVPAERPQAIYAFLKIMDDPAEHPVLIHCRAGLHRTGILAALYRMEYEGWTLDQALEELKANGFSPRQCTARNDYIMQYLLTYRPRNHAARFDDGFGRLAPP